MNRVRRALLTATTAVAVLAAMVPPLSATVVAPPPRDRPALQEGLDGVVAAGAVAAVAEVRDEHGTWHGTAGVAELGGDRPVPDRARFRAGSVTKTFVATVVLQLVGEGRLRLDDTVESWLPGVVPGGDRITLRHLLAHTSGLYDFLRTLTFPPAPEFLEYRSRTWTADELIRRALAHPPAFEPPGRAFAYSNTNYALLGEVLERATGRPYGELVEDRILRPLHLHETTLPGTTERIHGPHPHGYVPIREDGRIRLVDHTTMNPSLLGAGGEIVSTTRDLGRFFAALLGGRLLPARLLEQMTTPGVAGSRYGLGLFLVDTTCGIRAYGNDGDVLAYQAFAYATADLRRQVTLGLTPDFRPGLGRVVDAYLDDVLCGRRR